MEKIETIQSVFHTKKRLLVFHYTIPPYRVDFFNSLNEAFEMRFCGFSDHMKSQPYNYNKFKDNISFNPYWLVGRYNLGITKIPQGVTKEISRFNPNIVLTYEYGFVTILILLYRFLLKKSFKVVSLCDDSFNQIVENNDFKWTHRISRRLLAPFLDDIILVEPNVVKWYQKHYKKGAFFPIVREENLFRKQLESIDTIVSPDIISDKNVFLFVGRLVALKNVGFIIEAFSKLQQDQNLLVVVGDGPEIDNLRKQAINSGVNILFTGRLEGEDLLKWYVLADCFVLASLQEAFGAVTNEALLAGCWCLVSKRAGSQCLIKEGINGFTFDPNNADELTSKMTMSIGNFANQRNRLKENRMLFRYQDLMEDLVGRLNSPLLKDS